MSLVSIEGLTYTYPGAARAALEDVSVTIEPGEFVVIAGLSGSGKSTLLRAIGGLVPHFHGGTFAGTIRIGDLDTRDHGPGDLAAVVGSLFQDPETQIVLGTPRAELAFAAENRGWPAASVARAVEETALALAIEPLLDRSVHELSGGELQRVALGATLSSRPALICLDEPTSQLDPVAGDELIGLLRRLNEDGDAAVILAEHRLERCLGAADRVLAIDGGRLAFDGPPERFLDWAQRAAPALVTPGAKLLSGLGLAPVPGVKRARSVLRAAALAGDAVDIPRLYVDKRRQNRRGRADAALRFKGLWHEIKGGPAILRGVDLQVAPGERLVLMGRNGAGKSTLLKHAVGLMQPTRGRAEAAGRVALLLQNPSDYLVHDTVAEETGAGALLPLGLAHLAARHPRDLSGGEKQRLALAIVLGDPVETPPPAVLCLDEPTRGMDRAAKDDLSKLLHGLDAAVIVATHDPEFAAAFADRVVLLADGRVIADGGASEVLSGGTYFATETARILGGAGGALLPADGIALLRPSDVEVTA
ncbi:MAG TPA: ATP-binding cassette domain-containing protein [Solirubrobacteraceae bacterium]|jgi:energy-coupling factor transport system ATP-binding protein|nr:ATP-binding cassette domain-containing protein [Solirubrobacteraceae bacterium]